MGLLGVWLLLVLLLASPVLADAATVTFEPIVPEQGSMGVFSTGGFGLAFETEGFRFQMGADANDQVSLGGDAYCGPSCPYNGTNFLLLQDSGNFQAVTVSRIDGSEFDVRSFDVAESFVGTLFEAAEITATGITATGEIVTQ
jgi:hypothetical protein